MSAGVAARSAAHCHRLLRFRVTLVLGVPKNLPPAIDQIKGEGVAPTVSWEPFMIDPGTQENGEDYLAYNRRRARARPPIRARRSHARRRPPSDWLLQTRGEVGAGGARLVGAFREKEAQSLRLPLRRSSPPSPLSDPEVVCPPPPPPRTPYRPTSKAFAMALGTRRRRSKTSRRACAQPHAGASDRLTRAPTGAP